MIGRKIYVVRKKHGSITYTRRSSSKSRHTSIIERTTTAYQSSWSTSQHRKQYRRKHLRPAAVVTCIRAYIINHFHSRPEINISFCVSLKPSHSFPLRRNRNPSDYFHHSHYMNIHTISHEILFFSIKRSIYLAFFLSMYPSILLSI